MLSIFPELLPFGLLSATIIRVVVGLTLVYFAVIAVTVRKKPLIKQLKDNKYPLAKYMPWVVSGVAVITGGFILIGFLTQIAVLVAAYLFLNLSVIDNGAKNIFGQSTIFYIVMIVISLSLLFSGAGFFAVDLPL